jgi:hypothetical protein
LQVQVLMGLQQQVQMKCAACSGTGAEGAQVNSNSLAPPAPLLHRSHTASGAFMRRLQRPQDCIRGALPIAAPPPAVFASKSSERHRYASPQAAHVQYYIKPGTLDGGVCHVRGEGSCDPGEEPGDIQVKIAVQKHAVYSLKGSDLVCTQRVTLADLLRGQLVCAGARHDNFGQTNTALGAEPQAH